MALYVWGGNAAKQLGLDVDDKEVYDARVVTALQGQTIVDFSAGEQHSVAVNEFGEVFSWGRGREGQLGLGVQREAVVRAPERVAALDGHIIKKVSCGDTHTIALSVTGEVFMWGLLPETREVKNDGMFDHASVSLAGMPSRRENLENTSDIMTRLIRGSEEIYEELHLTKHDLDDAESSLSHLHSKKVQTVRHTCFSPRLATSLLRHRIINISAGFAHSLAVSGDGVVFSCGYNDSGQLGTGSRRNSADFTRVRNLEGFFITQIACGQQHSLACSRIEPLDASKSGVCFSWGLGMLGQLGSGVNVSWLPMEVNVGKPVIAIAAGSHHSVAVTADNKVYSWGHSEYGQHGAGERSQDLQRGLYYYFPRVQESLESQEIAVERVACSTHSTFALAKDGSVYSWGWNAFGILGLGKYQHSVHPQKITGLKDNVALHVSAGSNHCAIVARPRGCHYSLKYDHVLKHAAFHDLEFEVGDGPAGTTTLPAHQIVVCARSSYLRGLLRVLRSGAASRTVDGREVVVVDEFRDVDVHVFRAYLLFLYTNRLEIASHKRRILKEFALRVCAEDLADECQVSWRKHRPVVSEVDEMEASQFEKDLQPMVLSSEFADVEFLWPNEETEEENGDEETKASEAEPRELVALPAHKAVLSQVPYFHTMFSGGFSEGRAYTDSRELEPASSSNGSANIMHRIALHHMPQDGISLTSFKALLGWIYTGSVPSLRRLEPSQLMDLYVTASLIGLTVLAAQCEMLLINLLPNIEQDAESLQACLDFAVQFDARRLAALSTRALELWHGIVAPTKEGE